MSRSPKSTMAAVRGMGVAVMTSRSGSAPAPVPVAAPAPTATTESRPLSRSAARCSTPKRCCSSMTTSPSEWNRTSSVNSAWVPTTRSTWPIFSPARRRERSAAVVRLVSRATDSGRRPSRRPGSSTVSPAVSSPTAMWCCSARTSVGTMRAPWWPPWTAANRAATATTVLPDPTSPWRSRCMGSGPAISAKMAARARRWALVSSKGRPERNRRTRSGPSAASSRVAWPPSAVGPVASRAETAWRMARASCSRARRRSIRASCRRNSSSKASRRRAGTVSTSVSGRWAPPKASVRPTRPSRRRHGSGRGSAKEGTRRRAWATHSPTSQLERPALAEAG